MDAIIAQDKNCRVACETAVTTGVVMVMGEISTSCYVDIPLHISLAHKLAMQLSVDATIFDQLLPCIERKKQEQMKHFRFYIVDHSQKSRHKNEKK